MRNGASNSENVRSSSGAACRKTAVPSTATAPPTDGLLGQLEQAAQVDVVERGDRRLDLDPVVPVDLAAVVDVHELVAVVGGRQTEGQAVGVLRHHLVAHPHPQHEVVPAGHGATPLQARLGRTVAAAITAPATSRSHAKGPRVAVAPLRSSRRSRAAPSRGRSAASCAVARRSTGTRRGESRPTPEKASDGGPSRIWRAMSTTFSPSKRWSPAGGEHHAAGPGPHVGGRARRRCR